MCDQYYYKFDRPAETHAVSEEVIRSLQSVKHDCLIALDSLLKCIVVTLPSPTTTADQPPPSYDGSVRRKSDSALLPNSRLLGSIAHSTKRISQLGGSPATTSPMVRSESSPLLDMMTMSDVRRVLHSQQQVFSLLDRSKEYHLCYALAALLCNVYRVLELTSAHPDNNNNNNYDNEDEEEFDLLGSSSYNPNVYQRLREKVSAFRAREQLQYRQQPTHHAAAINQNDDVELTELWNEMDQLMDAVYCLGYEKCNAPPAYHTRDEEEEEEEDDDEDCLNVPPPPYVSEKTQIDLDNLFTAIDRLSQVAPRLNNQRVDMTKRQANELAAATIGKIVDRLALGRMNDQRATLSSSPSTTTAAAAKPKDVMLRDLIVQICHTASRSFDNQRVSMDSRLQKKMDTASMHGLFERMDRGRMADQEWTKKTPDERFREMSGMMDTVVKSLHRPRFSKQRFQMTATKERNMFMSDLFSKVDKMEGRRLDNQDAQIRPRSSSPAAAMMTMMPSPPPSPRILEEEEEDIFDLFDHMARSQLSNQRAVYRGPVHTTTNSNKASSPSCAASSLA